MDSRSPSRCRWRITAVLPSRACGGGGAHQNILPRKLEDRVWVEMPKGFSARTAAGTMGRPRPKRMKPRLNFIMPRPLVMPPSAPSPLSSFCYRCHSAKPRSSSVPVEQPDRSGVLQPTCSFPPTPQYTHTQSTHAPAPAPAMESAPAQWSPHPRMQWSTWKEVHGVRVRC